MDGVLSTRSVWVGDKEVVHVTYDPQVIEYQSLLKHARKMECTATVYTYDDNQRKIADLAKIDNVVEWDDSLETRLVARPEQKYYLRNSILAHLPLTELQAVKLNVALSSGDQDSAMTYLSPRQRRLLKRIQNVVETNQDALSGMSFPADQSALIDYNHRLTQRLQELENRGS